MQLRKPFYRQTSQRRGDGAFSVAPSSSPACRSRKLAAGSGRGVPRSIRWRVSSRRCQRRRQFIPRIGPPVTVSLHPDRSRSRGKHQPLARRAALKYKTAQPVRDGGLRREGSGLPRPGTTRSMPNVNHWSSTCNRVNPEQQASALSAGPPAPGSGGDDPATTWCHPRGASWRAMPPFGPRRRRPESRRPCRSRTA